VRKVVEQTAVNIDGLNPGLSGKLGAGRIDPLAALKFVGAGDARPAADRLYQIELVRTAFGGDSYGKTSVSVSGPKQELVVEAYNLNPRAAYSLFVDGNALASSVPASNLGSLRFDFAGDADSPLPTPISPPTKARHIELRTGTQAVLTGDFSGDTAPVAGFIARETKLIAAATAASSGNASIKVEALSTGGRRETLAMNAEGLAPDTLYRFIVDGLPITAFAPATAGFLRVVMTSDASSGVPLPAQIRPVTNIRRVEIQDSRGLVIAGGTFVATAQAIP